MKFFASISKLGCLLNPVEQYLQCSMKLPKRRKPVALASPISVILQLQRNRLATDEKIAVFYYIGTEL